MKWLSTGLIAAIIMFSVSCSVGDATPDNTTPTDTTISFSASLTGTSARSINISPSAYSIALVDFWLVDEAGTEVSLLNPDPDNPVYTDTNPKIVDFASGAAEILQSATVPPATYTGYKMRFTYLEMTYPIAFHVPSVAADLSDLAIAAKLDTVAPYTLRLYFNAVENLWRRDVTVELFPDTWYWMRRSIEGVNNTFFLPVADGIHLPGGAGPTSILDLFADPAFWGDDATATDTTKPIIIDSSSTVGGLNAGIEPFTLSGGNASLLLVVDVADTFNFGDDIAFAPDGVTFNAGILDLGPGYDPDGPSPSGPLDPDNYGDQGFHPFLPRFSFSATATD